MFCARITCFISWLLVSRAKSCFLIVAWCLCLQVCPVCGKKVGMDIVGHITTQHGSFLRISFLQFGSYISWLWCLCFSDLIILSWRFSCLMLVKFENSCTCLIEEIWSEMNNFFLWKVKVNFRTLAFGNLGYYNF